MSYWDMDHKERAKHHDAYLDAEYEAMQEHGFDHRRRGETAVVMLGTMIGVAVQIGVVAILCCLVYIVGRWLIG